MKYYNPLFSVIILPVIFCSCVSKNIIYKYKPEELSAYRVYEKNYEVGKVMSANVGSTIVRFKAFTVKRMHGDRMQPSSDFEISGGIFKVTGSANIAYPIRGITMLDGQRHTVVNLPVNKAGDVWGILITPEGYISSKVLNTDIIMLYDFKVTPPDVRFKYAPAKKVDPGAGSLNYEILYGGTDGKIINLTYREYTSENLVRPAFTQALVYDRNSSYIRFRDLVILVIDATNKSIVFVVTADGVEKTSEEALPPATEPPPAFEAPPLEGREIKVASLQLLAL